jgi:tRNA(Ile)-lysidine synthase
MNSPARFESPDRLVEEIGRFIASRDLIPRGSIVVAAVSGGPDSIALLSILHRLSAESGYSIAVAHFDHQLRPRAQAELEQVRQFASSLDLPFCSGSENVGALAQSTGDSLEEAARKARYRFLERTAGELAAERIVTGHTLSDHVETVLMRIIRGTGLRGLSGIPVRRGDIVRPLLGITREDTVEYCRAVGLAVTEDPSNEDSRFFRNRVRHELLPLLEREFHPAIRENLATLAENARVILESIRLRTRPIIREGFAPRGADQWTLDIGEMLGLDETSMVVLFGDVFADELQCDMDFTRVHYEELVRLVLDPHASGRALSLPGLTVRREHAKIVIARSPAVEERSAGPLQAKDLSLPGDTVLPGYRVTTRIVEGGFLSGVDFAATENEAYFDLSRLEPPLTVRSPRPGDRIQPFGMTGTKKLSDIFIDKKIPASARPTSLVIADARDILWLVGIVTSEKCRVGPAAARAVRVRVERI